MKSEQRVPEGQGIPAAASTEEHRQVGLAKFPHTLLNSWWEVLHPGFQACWAETGSRKFQASPASFGFLLTIRVTL